MSPPPPMTTLTLFYSRMLLMGELQSTPLRFFFSHLMRNEGRGRMKRRGEMITLAPLQWGKKKREMENEAILLMRMAAPCSGG